jgi:hypothetical protein
MLGRTFLPSEDSYSSPHVALLSHCLWSGEFHSDPQIVAKNISLNGDPYYVVGVMPPDFRSPDDEKEVHRKPCRDGLPRLSWTGMAFPIKVCTLCSEEFELKPDKPGFVNRCPACSTVDPTESVAKPRMDADERKTQSEANEARRQAMRELLYRKDS